MAEAMANEDKVKLQPGHKADFAKPSRENNANSGTITCILENTKCTKKLYALTAGHCVEVGDVCVRKQEVFGKCIFTYDDVTDIKGEEKSVDAGLIEVYDTAKDFVRKHIIMHKTEKKTDVKVEDPEVGRAVHLLQPNRRPKLPKLEVGEIEQNINIEIEENSSTARYKGVFFLKNQVDGEGSELIGGDSGTCVLLDEQREECSGEKAVVYGMVVAYFIDDGDPKKAVAITSCKHDKTRRKDERSVGIALPMKRIVDYISAQLDLPLKLCGVIPPLPVMLEDDADKPEKTFAAPLPATIRKEKQADGFEDSFDWDDYMEHH